jgi:N-acetylated-alpha-linked acidic dipeptidase
MLTKHSFNSLDVSVAGSQWVAHASPSLAHLVLRAAQDVPHPTEANKTLCDARHDVGPFQGKMDKDFEQSYKAERAKSVTKGAGTGINPLGSGSDFTVFLQRLGVRLLPGVI